jgi:hypothetical protein
MTLVITFMEKYTLFPKKRNNYDESHYPDIRKFKVCPLPPKGGYKTLKVPFFAFA